MINFQTPFRQRRKRSATEALKHRNLQWHKYSLQKIADDKLTNVLPSFRLKKMPVSREDGKFAQPFVQVQSGNCFRKTTMINLQTPFRLTG